MADEDSILAELGEDAAEQLREEVELLDGSSADFDLDEVRAGNLTPVFFGSALNNFGVEIFLRHFLEMAPAPSARMTDQGPVDPVEDAFSAFVFKIQANMNKAHRDRIAFIRICSGKYDIGMDVKHVQSGRVQRLSQPQQLMADDRKILSEAYAGDIIGVAHWFGRPDDGVCLAQVILLPDTSRSAGLGGSGLGHASRKVCTTV